MTIKKKADVTAADAIIASNAAKDDEKRAFPKVTNGKNYAVIQWSRAPMDYDIFSPTVNDADTMSVIEKLRKRKIYTSIDNDADGWSVEITRDSVSTRADGKTLSAAASKAINNIMGKAFDNHEPTDK